MKFPGVLSSSEVLSGCWTALDGHLVPVQCHVHGHDRCIVLVHGFYNSKDAVVLQDLAGELSGAFDVVLLDLRGHGKSPGLFTWTSKEWMDLKVVLERVRPRYRKVGVIGFSLGGLIAINTLSRYPLADALVCVATPVSLGGVDYHFWEKSMWRDFVYTLLRSEGRRGKGVRPGPFWGPRESAADRIAEVKVPILFIHGTADWVVKPEHSRRLYDAASTMKKLVIIEGGPHAEYLLRDCRERFLNELRAWCAETL